MTKISNPKYYSIFALLLSGCMCIIFACRNDIETIQALTSESKLPHITGFDIELDYTDSGHLKGKILAPEVYQFNNAEVPYYEFPKGMTAILYDSAGGSYNIHANYGIYLYERQLWEGRNQVVINNKSTGLKIETEQIFWDQKEKRIYSDKYTKVTNKDGVFIGENGIEADDALTKYRMMGYSGTVNVTDNPAPSEKTESQ
jgi:LPS export ABC transporter protein LptC